MAIGGGMYVVGIVSTAIILAIQFALHINSRFTFTPKNKRIKFFNVTEDGFQDKITNKLSELNVYVSDVSIERESIDSGLNYVFYVEMLKTVKEEELIKLSEYPCTVES